MFKLAFAVAVITGVIGLVANQFWRSEEVMADERRKIKAAQVVRAVKAIKAKS